MVADRMSEAGCLREIVNGSQLQRFIGKKVSLIGMVTDVVNSGTTFSVRAVDNNIVQVNLKRPVDSPVEGYVEVQGTSQGNSILADNFIMFSNSQFDARAHNSLITLLNTLPDLYKNSSSK